MPDNRTPPRGFLDAPVEGSRAPRRALVLRGWVDAPELSGQEHLDLEISCKGRSLPRLRAELRDRPDVRQAMGLLATARNGFQVVADLEGICAGPEQGCQVIVKILRNDRVLLSWERTVELIDQKASGNSKPIPDYDQDGLVTVHNNEFVLDKRFHAAYTRGILASGVDYGFQWRIHLALWAASHASKLPGDFVECGVNAGFVSSAIMRYLDWDRLGKTFFLLDTFRGLDSQLLSQEEIAGGVLDRNNADLARGFYVTDAAKVKKNFSEWKNHRIIEGSIPGTLPQVSSREIAFLHLDLNCATPEIAAMEFFWERLVDGAVILLDDYAYAGFRLQKLAMDRFAAGNGSEIASLPTGQGLMLRPPRKHHIKQ